MLFSVSIRLYDMHSLLVRFEKAFGNSQSIAIVRDVYVRGIRTPHDTSSIVICIHKLSIENPFILLRLSQSLKHQLLLPMSLLKVMASAGRRPLVINRVPPPTQSGYGFSHLETRCFLLV